MDFYVRITDRSALRALAKLQGEMPGILQRGLTKFALLVGREIAQRAPRRTGRLARSFLVPTVSATHVVLGKGVPIYGAIHEYGGTIKPKHGDYLTFQPEPGRWVSVKQVTIREKRYARGGVEAAKPLAPIILGREVANAFRG